jgi:hypothetical protein
MRMIAAFLLLIIAAPVAAQPGEPFPETRLSGEAFAFMAGYAEDLRHGNREGIAARYSRNGAWLVGEGAATRETRARLTAIYAGADWHPPTRFEWRDLSYEFIGRDAVLVIGKFLWTPGPATQPLTFSYTALLRREDGRLRIVMEHESTGARPTP